MKRGTLNYIVDMLLLVTFLFISTTGIMKWPGLMKDLGFRGIPNSTINTIHDWSGLTLVVLVLIHLVLHFDWIINMTKLQFKKLGKKK